MPFNLGKIFGRPSASDINKLIDAINKLDHQSPITVRGSGTRVSRGPNGTMINISGIGDKEIFRAITEETGTTTDGLLYVKKVDASGDAFGDAFDVFTSPDQAAFDMTDYLPVIADEQTVFIMRVANEWYLNWTPIEVGTAASTVSVTATTIFGRVMNVIGKW